MEQIVSAKQHLRAEIPKTLSTLPFEFFQEKSTKISEEVLKLVSLCGARAVSVYLSREREVQTNRIVSGLFSMEGMMVYVPKVVGHDRHEMCMPRVYSEEEVRELPISKWGIPEMPLELVKERLVDQELIDFVVIPGVAFDRQGQRLGHGKGHYDTFIHNLRGKRIKAGMRPPVTVGIALDEQIVDLIPLEDHDEHLDYIVTPTVVYQS